MGGDHREMADRVVVVAGCGEQGRKVATGLIHPRRDPPQDRVGEPDRPLTTGIANQVDR